VFLPVAMRRRVTFPAKVEYFRMGGPVGIAARLFFRGTGQIPIDRSSGRAALAALDVGAGILRAGGVFGIYPEGTRSPDGRLHRGKTGVARLALTSGAPVVPVALMNLTRSSRRRRLPRSDGCGSASASRPTSPGTRIWPGPARGACGHRRDHVRDHETVWPRVR
jgi:1-acyl-sn-glycerol-3-phosphate acyltransferase